MFEAIATQGRREPAVPLSPLSPPETAPRGDAPLFAAIRAPSGAPPALAAAPSDERPSQLFAAVARTAAPLAVDAAGKAPSPSRAMFEAFAGSSLAVEGNAASAAPWSAPSMFARLVTSDLRGRAAQRMAWTVGAAALQAVIVAAVLTGSAHARGARREVVVEVAVLAPRAPRRNVPPPPPPPPALSARHASGAATPRPRPTGAPRPIPPLAIVQPREIKAEMKAPAPGEPREDAGEEGGDAEYGVVGGVVGGVPGGVIGGVVGAETLAAAPAQERRGPEIEDAPQYMSAGYRKPAEREPGCFRRAIRLPRDLVGYVSGQMTVRFAVGRDGNIGRVDVLGGEPDARVLSAIAQALRSCAWVAGADARGEPVAIWVVMPLRFEMG